MSKLRAIIGRFRRQAAKPERATRKSAGTVRHAAGRFFDCPVCGARVDVTGCSVAGSGARITGECRKCKAARTWGVTWVPGGAVEGGGA